MSCTLPYFPLYNLFPSSQRPANINQCRSRTNVRKRPWHSNITQVSRIMHQQLRNDMEPQQVHHLRICRRNDLRKCRCECECYIFISTLPSFDDLSGVHAYQGSSPSTHNAHFAFSVAIRPVSQCAFAGGRCRGLPRGSWLGQRRIWHLMRRKSRRGRGLRERGWRGQMLWLLSTGVLVCWAYWFAGESYADAGKELD
jgi:hypothetical protein